jgi:hypothetical protein
MADVGMEEMGIRNEPGAIIQVNTTRFDRLLLKSWLIHPGAFLIVYPTEEL